MNCTLMETGVGLSGLGELEYISKNLRHESPQDKILSHVLRGVKHMPNLIQNFPYQPQTGWPMELEVVTMECGIHGMWRKLMTAT